LADKNSLRNATLQGELELAEPYELRGFSGNRLEPVWEPVLMQPGKMPAYDNTVWRASLCWEQNWNIGA
jgi:hypothetical protein